MSNTQHNEISECPHDKEHPYTMINNALIRDASISPLCRWMLIFLLSHPKGWKVKISHISNHLSGYKGRSRGNIYGLINEAIAAGYMARESFCENNMKRYRYFLSESKYYSNIFSCVTFSGEPVDVTVIKELSLFPPVKEKERNIVCYASGGPPQDEKIKIISPILENQGNGTILPVNQINKTHPDNRTITIKLDDVFLSSIMKKNDWKTSEINEAWKILCDYKGKVRDGVAFIEGTIKKLRNAARSKYLSKQQKEKTQCSLTNNLNTQKECKQNLLASATPGQPSLLSLLMEITKK